MSPFLCKGQGLALAGCFVLSTRSHAPLETPQSLRACLAARALTLAAGPELGALCFAARDKRENPPGPSLHEGRGPGAPISSSWERTAAHSFVIPGNSLTSDSPRAAGDISSPPAPFLLLVTIIHGNYPPELCSHPRCVFLLPVHVLLPPLASAPQGFPAPSSAGFINGSVLQRDGKGQRREEAAQRQR